ELLFQGQRRKRAAGPARSTPTRRCPLSEKKARAERRPRSPPGTETLEPKFSNTSGRPIHLLDRQSKLNTFFASEHRGPHFVTRCVLLQHASDQFAFSGVPGNAIHFHEDIAFLKSCFLGGSMFPVLAGVLDQEGHLRIGNSSFASLLSGKILKKQSAR